LNVETSFSSSFHIIHPFSPCKLKHLRPTLIGENDLWSQIKLLLRRIGDWKFVLVIRKQKNRKRREGEARSAALQKSQNKRGK